MTNHPKRHSAARHFTYAGNIATVFVGQGRVADQIFASGPTVNNVPAARSFQTNDPDAMVKFVGPHRVAEFASALAAARPGDAIYCGDYWNND